MKEITAGKMHFSELNEQVRSSRDSSITIHDCLGQRYIASGLGGKKITINGIPGNALGAYMDGSIITVNGNVQDATGDTMNTGAIIVHGNAGDATGYGMRGGAIYVRGNTGYRAGIHMKEYQEMVPVIVVGGKAGSFLGEYQAGGILIVLGLEPPASGANKKPKTKMRERGLTGFFCGTGMHGGVIYLRTENPPTHPAQIEVSKAKARDVPELKKHIEEFCVYFNDVNKEAILDSTFCILTPATNNPYTQLYTHK
jgi:glutamate synthase domain-containing protein 3